MSDLTIIIPWRPGGPHREASLAFVTVWLRQVFPDANLELADDGGDPFSRGASIDQAVERSDASLFVVCDADIVVPASQLVAAAALAAEADGQVIPFESYRYLTGQASEQLRAGPISDQDWEALPVEWSYSVAVGAACAFSRATHEQAGGHPGFRGWGMEDVAFFLAAETLVAPMRRVPGPVFHLWHPTGTEASYRDPAAMAANVALLDRYGAAEGDPVAMGALIGELRGIPSPEADV